MAPETPAEVEPLRLIVVYFGPFNVNSAIQAFHFGNDLTEIGWPVTVAGVGDPAAIEKVGQPKFDCVSHHDLPEVVERARRARERPIVLAWTPRENVRIATEAAVARLGCPYVVHLEDNEIYLLERSTGLTLDELRRLPAREQAAHAGPLMVHPGRFEGFLAGASGVTMITEALDDFNPAGRPHHIARPGIDSKRFRPDVAASVDRRRLGLAADDFVLVYHGTVHYANQHEMLSLYAAVSLLRRRGRPVRLVRLGETDLGGVDAAAFGALRDGVVELGSVDWRLIPSFLALADAFVQPGAPNDFNRYRLPSKLPEFLAMGRPVVLPACNIGDDLTDGRNALLLARGDAREIADRIERLIDDPALAARLGEGAREFALTNLDWKENSMALARFLTRIVAGAKASDRAEAAAPGA